MDFGECLLYKTSMSKGFLTHFITILVLHIALIFGGYRILDSELSPSIAKSGTLSVIVGKIQKSTPREVPKTVSRPSDKTTPTPKEEVVEEVSGSSKGYDFGNNNDGVTNADAIALYKAELRAQIDKNKYYPPMSKRLGQTGVVVVAFTLLHDGNIIDVRVEKPSRYERLNASALDAVKKVQRFKPIPKEIGESRMDIKVPLKFVTI